MRVHKTRALGRPIFAAAICVGLLPQSVWAQSVVAGGLAQGGSTPGQGPAFALAPGLAPANDTLWTSIPAWSSSLPAPAWRSLAAGSSFDENPGLPSFEIGGYDAMWDDTKFSEISAYGGLKGDALRVAGMRAIDGSAAASEAIPYGRLTVERDFVDGEHRLSLDAYGTEVSVRQTGISGFGDDSYTDVAVDGAWRWTPHPDRGISDAISAHVFILHESENLIASHAIFGTRRSDDLTVFRGDASWSWGSNIAPTVQYFRVTGSSDPVRLGTPDGSPDSGGFIAGIDYLPPSRSPLNLFNVRLSLEFVDYSKFDGSSRNAAQNNAVLLHLTAFSDPAP